MSLCVGVLGVQVLRLQQAGSKCPHRVPSGMQEYARCLGLQRPWTHANARGRAALVLRRGCGMTLLTECRVLVVVAQVGRAVAELALHGSFQTLDLSRMAPGRYLDRDGYTAAPLLERNVI